MTPDRRREIEAFAAGAGRDLRVLTDTLAALAAAEARVEQAERERDEALVLTGGRVNDAARLVDELTTLLYCPFGTYRGRQQVACGACAKQADKPESVVHESDCPVYRLQQAEAANDAIIKANAEDIADLEDARDAADARANAEWARAEGEQLRADVAALRADRAERFAALWKWAAKVERDRAEQAERERDAERSREGQCAWCLQGERQAFALICPEHLNNYRTLLDDLQRDIKALCRAVGEFDGARPESPQVVLEICTERASLLRERLATVEAVLSRYGEESNWFRTFHPQDDGWLQPVWAWDTMEDPKQIARAALAATPAAGEVDGFDPAAPRVRFENVAEVIEWLKSDDDDHRREQQQHGGESGE